MHGMSQALHAHSLRYVWDHAPILLVRFDGNGSLVEANHYTKGLLEGAEARTFGQVFVDFTRRMSLNALAETPGPHRLDVARPSGPPVTHLCWVDRVEDGHIVCGAVDLAESDRMQDQILALNRELSNTTRALHKSNSELNVLNRLKNQFLGMAAHDLRKPLGVIETYVGFVLDEARDGLESEHIGFLETVQNMGRGMARLIDDFLDVSIIESGQLELHIAQTRMRDVVEHVCALVGPVAQRTHVVVETEDVNGVPDLALDAPKVEQVLANLVSNAIEYSPSGASVLIRTRVEGGRAVVSVADRGPGISDEQKRTLFNAFARGKTVKAGKQRSVGLGLMISKKIVEAHGGEISVESELGAGSVFTVSLPLQRSKHEVESE